MRITCPICSARFDDEFRTTIYPHETFAANDGRNNFAHHPESLLIPAIEDDPMVVTCLPCAAFPADETADSTQAATEYADQHCPVMFEIPGMNRQTKEGIISGVKALLREAFIAGRESGNA